MKLERLTTDPIHDEDGSGQVTLSNGRVIGFRGPTVGDIRAIRRTMRQENIPLDDEVELALRLAARCCIRYGEQADINLVQLEELSINDFAKVSEAMAPFLGASSTTTTSDS